MKKLNLIFLAALAGLIIIGLATLAICIWILESWWARIGLCLGVGCFLMMVFYGIVFWLAALANRIDSEARKCSVLGAQGDENRNQESGGF